MRPVRAPHSRSRLSVLACETWSRSRLRLRLRLRLGLRLRIGLRIGLRVTVRVRARAKAGAGARMTARARARARGRVRGRAVRARAGVQNQLAPTASPASWLRGRGRVRLRPGFGPVLGLV